jgi:hypothetical protein
MFDALSSSADPAATAAIPPGGAPEAPARFPTDLWREFRRLATPPREDLSVLLFNGVLVAGCWFLLPVAARDWLFERHGPMAFAFVLQSWMLADTPTTNVLGNDVPAALRALPDQRRLRRLLRVKAASLAAVVGVISAVTSIVTAALQGRYVTGLVTAAFLVALSFGTAAVSQWLGIFLPYHRRSLRWRWAHRRPWRMTARWLTLIVLPYSAVPLVSAALATPITLVALAAGNPTRHGHLTRPSLLIGALFASLVAVLAYPLGSWIGAWMAARRARSLQAYLSDPDSG